MADKISIIDDNENLLTSLSIQLQTCGYKVKTFTCPQQALDFHIKEPADFYIIDIMMPKLTGVEFYKALCQKLCVKKLPAIFLVVGDSSKNPLTPSNPLFRNPLLYFA